MAPPCCCPRPPSLLPKNAICEQLHLLSRAYLNVSDPSDCVTHIWPNIPMVCNDIQRDSPECDPPSTHVHTYVLCENRSSIQSLTLMCSAIIRNVISVDNSPPRMPVTVPLRPNGTALLVETLTTRSNSS